MIFLRNDPEVSNFVHNVHQEIKSRRPLDRLQNKALEWLAFCMTGLIVTGALNWLSIERASAGTWKSKALSWMLHHSPINWKTLFQASVALVIRTFCIKDCHLTFDDLDRHRSKRTKRIYGTFKTRNKNGGGYVNSQNVVLLVLVAKGITFPVGFEFYRPDPKRKAWRKNDDILRRAGIRKKDRPAEPQKDRDYPTKKEAAARLLRQFKYHHNKINVRSVAADGVYTSKKMRAECRRIFPNVQYLTRMPLSQKVITKSKSISVKKYFESKPLTTKKFSFRNGVEVVVEYCSARLVIRSHGRKYHIVAFRYQGEHKFRYVCATELTWRAEDIIRTYSFRWLCEVVIEDLKLYDGWGKAAMQHGYGGASRGLCLSLLLDHFLLLHPVQQRLHQAGRPLATTGSMRQKLQLESLCRSIEMLVESDDPVAEFRKLASQVESLVVLRPSRKHMYGDDVATLGPSPSLLKKFANSS